MGPTVRRCLAAVLAAVAVAAGLAACGSGGGATITTSAVFSNVSSLTTGASVQMAGVDVGEVTGIHLVGDRAKVTLAVQKDARVPAAVTAELKQTTILGQYVVALVPTGHGMTLLRDGEPITGAEVVPGIEQLVQSGTQLFTAVDAGQLSALIDNGARAFGGEGARIRALLDDFGTVLAGYASQSGQITSLIDNIDRFSTILAPSAGADARAVGNLAQTAGILAQQSQRFVGLLQSLDALATQGRSILDTGIPQIQDQVSTLAALAGQLDSHQQQLATLLQELPAANTGLARASYQRYLQVLNNIIVCGVPGLGEGSTPTTACSGSGT